MFVSLVRDEQGHGSVLDGSTVFALLLALVGTLGLVAYSSGLSFDPIFENKRRTLMCGVDATSTAVDSTWRRIELEMKDPRSVDGLLHIALLRPDVWVRAAGARVGALIDLEMPEMHLRGRARVTSVGDAPPIKAGPGRVVLSTIASQSDAVLVLRFEETDETLEPTVSHPLFSIDRNEWVRAETLRIGERLRTMHGSAKIASVARKPGIHRVYNLEVETEHEYLVSNLGVQSHNDQPCGQPPRPNVGWGRKVLDFAEASVRRPLQVMLAPAAIPIRFVSSIAKRVRNTVSGTRFRAWWRRQQIEAVGPPRNGSRAASPATGASGAPTSETQRPRAIEPAAFLLARWRAKAVQPWARDAVGSVRIRTGAPRDIPDALLVGNLPDDGILVLQHETFPSFARGVGTPLPELVDASPALRAAMREADAKGIQIAVGRPSSGARTRRLGSNRTIVVLDSASRPEVLAGDVPHELAHALKERTFVHPAEFDTEEAFVRAALESDLREECRAILFEEHVLRQGRVRGVEVRGDGPMARHEQLDEILDLYGAGQLTAAEERVREVLSSPRVGIARQMEKELRAEWASYQLDRDLR